MMRFVIFSLLFPSLAMLVFICPDVVSKGIPSSDDLLAWLVASYPIAVVPALFMAWVDQALLKQPAHVLKTTAVGGVMSVLVALFLSSGYAELWPVVMMFLVGALPAAVCSLVSDYSHLVRHPPNSA